MKGSLKKRGNTYTAVLELPRKPDGRRNQKWISLGTKSKKEAERKLAELLVKVHTGTYADAQGMTVAQFLEDYHEHARASIKQRSRKREAEIIKNQINPTIGHIKLGELGPLDIQWLYAELRKTGSSKGGPLSERSVQYVHAVLHKAFNHAIMTGLMAVNTTDRVEKPKPRPVERKAMTTPQEIFDLFVKVRHTANYLPIVLAATLGARASEILALNWGDVDFNRGTVTFRRMVSQDENNNPVYEDLKTDSSRRTIPIPEWTLQELKTHKTGWEELREKLGPEYNPEGIICPRLDGSLHKPKSFASSVRDTLRRAGCSLTFHDLRHSHATVLAYMGVSFKEIQERLGHTLLSTTMNIYLHAAPNMQKRAIQQFDQHLQTAASNDQTEVA